MVPPGYYVPRAVAPSSKSFLLTWLLSYFFGSAGFDRFYLGKIGTGVLKLLTFGGFGIWTLFDLVRVLAGNQTDKNGRELEGYEQHRTVAILVTIGLFVLGAGANVLLLSGTVASYV